MSLKGYNMGEADRFEYYSCSLGMWFLSQLCKKYHNGRLFLSSHDSFSSIILLLKPTEDCGVLLSRSSNEQISSPNNIKTVTISCKCFNLESRNCVMGDYSVAKSARVYDWETSPNRVARPVQEWQQAEFELEVLLSTLTNQLWYQFRNWSLQNEGWL